MRPRIAIAAGTPLAASIAVETTAEGGNAVDAAVAATFATWVCEPGLTAIGSGGFCCVWPANGEPVTIDGFAEMPGRGAATEAFGVGRHVEMTYGGGTTTIVGPGSAGTPGALAAVEMAWRRHGRMPWRQLVEPAAAIAREGFPLPAVSQQYFGVSGGPIYDETEGGRRLYRRPDDTIRPIGDSTTIPELADTLDAIGREGARVFYEGEVAARMGSWVREHGGLLGLEDLRAYRAVERPCLRRMAGDWYLATNPGPAVGGVVLLELVDLMGQLRAWDAAAVARFSKAMELAFTDRTELLSGDGERDDETWLAETVRARLGLLSSPATSHASAVDADGLACSITTSTGYGSGVMVPGTGVMLNNMLGEIELAPGGYHAAEPGQRLLSNMAPSVARSHRGNAIAFGAAGSDRIVSALAQLWLNISALGEDLTAAVASPRCHLDWRDDAPTLSFEPGIDVTRVEQATRAFEGAHMFFGGVQAAERRPDGSLIAVGDPRRAGGAEVK